MDAAACGSRSWDWQPGRTEGESPVCLRECRCACPLWLCRLPARGIGTQQGGGAANFTWCACFDRGAKNKTAAQLETKRGRPLSYHAACRWALRRLSGAILTPRAGPGGVAFVRSLAREPRERITRAFASETRGSCSVLLITGSFCPGLGAEQGCWGVLNERGSGEGTGIVHT